MLYAGMWTQISPFWVQNPETDGVSYNGAYTYDVCRKIAWIFEYVDVSELDIQKVFHDMLQTDFKMYLETCHPHYIGGCSPAQFAEYVLLDTLGLNIKNTENAAPVTSAYWTGWYMAMFQWLYNVSWDDMDKYCKVDMVRNQIFPAGHTTDDSHILRAFILRINEAGLNREFKDPDIRLKEIEEISKITKKVMQEQFDKEHGINTSGG